MGKTTQNTIMTLVAAAFVLSAADPVLGTWKANTAKSKYSPGPAPQSVTAVYSQDGDWIVLKSATVGADGKSVSSTNRYKTDGAEYPFNGPLIGKGTIAVKRIDDLHLEAVLKSASGNVLTVRTVLSKDGKTRTQTSTGTNNDGKKTNNTVVFEKQ